MYRLEIFINAYDKAELIEYLQYIYEALRYDKQNFVHYADSLSNEYFNAILYKTPDEYDDEKYCEQKAMAQPVFNDFEKDKEYYYYKDIVGLSDKEAKREVEEMF